MPLLVSPAADALEEFPLDLPTRAYLGDSGIVLGNGDVTDDDGCTWYWAPTNAWGSKPAPREQTGDLSYDHGQWDATRYHGPRNLPIPGSVRAPSHAALHAAEQRLRDTVTVEGFTLRITEPGFDSYAIVRQSGDVLWTEDGDAQHFPHATFSIGLYAPDPLIYSSLERDFALQFPAAGGGRTWPAVWPATWPGAGGAASAQVLPNPGRLPAALQLQVLGPANDVSISFPELGQSLNLDNPSAPILAAGETLLIDTARRRILLDGNANRRSWMFGDWLQLPGLANTTIAIAGTGTTSASAVTGSYRAVRL